MNEHHVQEALAIAKSIRRDLARNAQGSVTERLDELIELLERMLEGDSGITQKDVLDAFGRVATASGPIASLIETIIKSL